MDTINIPKIAPSEKMRVLSIIQSRTTPQEAIGSEQFGLPGGTVRKIVQQLRREGHPICTISGVGYYYACTAEEVLQTIKYIQTLQNGLEKTLAVLNATYNNYKINEINGGI